MQSTKKTATDSAVKTKSRKRTPKPSVVVEFLGRQYDAEEVGKRALAACKEKFNEPIESFKVYFKPSVNEAYYVVNGEGSPEYKISV